MPELGLTGFNAAVSRTAIGLALNLPQCRINDTFQYQNNLSYVRGRHAFKTGIDIRRINVESFFFPTIRGRMVYPTLQRLVDDNAETATINKPLPGGQAIQFYDWTDVFAIASLYPVNDAIVAEAGGDERNKMTSRPYRDVNNFQPRIGFNWNPRTSGEGLTGSLTGGDKLVVRGGYARTNDYAFININLNIASAFPFVAAYNEPNMPNAFVRLPNVELVGLNPNTFARTIVSDDFRSPSANQFSLEVPARTQRVAVVPRAGQPDRQVPRRLAAQLGVHVPERRAVHGAQWVGPDGRPGGYRWPSGQRHPSEHQHRHGPPEHVDRGDSRSRGPEPVPHLVRQSDRDLRG